MNNDKMVYAKFRKHFGYVVAWQHTTVSGYYDEAGLKRAFGQCTWPTLFIGWVSPMSIILAPLTVIGNIATYASAKRQLARI